MTNNPTITTQSHWRIHRETFGGGTVVLDRPARRSVQTGAQSRIVKNAVLTHIKALRALGNTRTNTSDIAEALGVPRVLVEQAVGQLKDEGVKVVK